MRRSALSALALGLIILSMAPSTAGYSMVYRSTGQELFLSVPDDAETECRAFTGCPDSLQDVSFRDHHIGPYVAGSDDAMYALTSSAHVAYLVTYEAIVTWEICMFDADQTLIGCNQHTGERLTVAEVEDGTEYLRVILRSGFFTEYALQIFA